MQIELSAEEVVFLRQALDNYIPELDYELARVKRTRDRHSLVLLAQALIRVRSRLDQAVLASGSHLTDAVP
jgi:hypothetical protein